MLLASLGSSESGSQDRLLPAEPAAHPDRPCDRRCPFFLVPSRSDFCYWPCSYTVSRSAVHSVLKLGRGRP
jgi:hypothetical protein